MNQVQKKYLLKRIDEVMFSLKNKARDKYTTYEVRLSSEEKVELIKTNKVKFDLKGFLDSIVPSSYKGDINYGRISTFFDFHKYETEHSLDKKFYAIDQKIDIEAQRLKDTLVLGDAEGALESLKKFAEMEI